MVLYCWRDGTVQMGAHRPAGAIEIARGGSAPLHRFLARVVADGAITAGRLPGMAEAANQTQALTMLRGHLSSLMSLAGGVALNLAADPRFIGSD